MYTPWVFELLIDQYTIIDHMTLIYYISSWQENIIIWLWKIGTVLPGQMSYTLTLLGWQLKFLRKINETLNPACL